MSKNTNTVVTTHAKKSTKPKAKKHAKHAHRVEIHKVENGFKAMTHYPMDDAENGMAGYQEPEEHVFSGPTAHKDAFAHIASAMPDGVAEPEGEPEGDEGQGQPADKDGDE